MKIKKRLVFIVLIVIIAFFFLFLSVKQDQIGNGSVVKSYGGDVMAGTKISYDNLADILSENQMIKELPSNAVILLRFYNFNSGERVWEKSYILKKENIEEGFIDKADLTLTLHSKYLSQLTTDNFCSVIKAAKSNGDLGAYSDLSTTALLWKFKSMLKYRECLGF